MRPGTTRFLNENSGAKPAKESFTRNVAKFWNQVAENIKDSKTLTFQSVVSKED